MSELIPRQPASVPPEPEHSSLLAEEPSREESRRRWEVRAAQWHACELAEASFGGVESKLVSMSTSGPFRGLLRLDVPFDSLGTHRLREAEFLASVGSDALLSRVPLVYVLGPGPA